jgi:hypothetical protein
MSKENISSDEVDLGNLFKIIGKGIQNFFNSIGLFFASLYHYIILFLLFLRNNAIKLGLAAFIGGAIGLYLDLTKQTVFSSKMVVAPNFKSTQQLYNNIKFYHELVQQRDTALLAKSLNISAIEASKLKGFYIEPVKNENEKYELFNKFMQEVDTTVVKNLDIKDFKKGFSDFDYKYHQIIVKSTNSVIFSKLGNPIVNSVENNPYYKNLKSINDQNFLQNQKVLVKSLSEIDTLRKIYNEVLLTEAKKMGSGTSITLTQGVKKTEEVGLFNESLKLNEELIANNKKKAEVTEILNVVSTFNETGIKERTFYKKNTFRIGILFFILMFLITLLRQLNDYLIKYKKIV